jgi:hypothetical protein
MAIMPRYGDSLLGIATGEGQHDRKDHRRE